MRESLVVRYSDVIDSIFHKGGANGEIMTGKGHKMLMKLTEWEDNESTRVMLPTDEDIEFMAEMSKRNTSSSFFN